MVDDHPMVREGMKRLLEGEGGFEVVGEVESVEEALEELERGKVEIVLMEDRSFKYSHRCDLTLSHHWAVADGRTGPSIWFRAGLSPDHMGHTFIRRPAGSTNLKLLVENGR